MTSGLYKIINKENEKFYIGSSVNIERRIYDHFYKLKKNTHDNPHLQRAFNLNPDNFYYIIFKEILEKENILKEEQLSLNENWDNCINCYNVSKDVFKGMLGRKMSEESKEKIRKKALGRKHTNETKSKMSISRTGEKNVMFGKRGELSPLFGKERVGVSMEGENNPMFGKHHSEETKKALSEKFKGREGFFKGSTHTPEAKEKIAERAKGRKVSVETKKKFSDARKGEGNSMYGKKHSSETKAKIGLANKLIRQKKKIEAA